MNRLSAPSHERRSMDERRVRNTPWGSDRPAKRPFWSAFAIGLLLWVLIYAVWVALP